MWGIVIVNVVQIAIIMPFISVVSNAEYVMTELQWLLKYVYILDITFSLYE